jgi:uncharacterized protein (TIGR03435 family)
MEMQTVSRVAIPLACAAILAAQDHVEFEVASVKPSNSVSTSYSFNTNQSGEFIATNVTLRGLIAFAYNIRDFQLTGGPKWIDADRYDIVARPPHDEGASQKSAAERTQLTYMRMKALLADRFQLVVHSETKDLPVYVLVVAKNGPHLSPADPANPRKGISHNTGVLECFGTSMKTFAERGLAPRLGNIVLDKTGLAGEFNFKVQYAEEVPAKPGAVQPEAADPAGPSLASALREQLGLKLETQKAPVETIVVDRAEKASAN